jgi:Flp pilus assembly protein TadG
VAVGLIALLLVVLLGMAALAVDFGMLLAARTEAQRAADAGALSGALSLLESPGNADQARAKAIEYAALNQVRGVGTTVLAGDVDVILAQDRVRVRVIRSSARGSALANFFARILGINTSDISAEAAAHAAVAAGVTCPWPFVIVDRWWETSAARLANSTDVFNSGVDVYNEGPVPAHPGGPALNTGYGEDDRGTLIRMYPGSPGDAPLPGW